MQKLAVACLTIAIVTGSSSSAYAWGAAAHRFIIDRAIDLLPPELKPFFDHFRTELVVRVVDPDTWRTAGWEDDPSHFMDFGMPEFGAYPFAALPREYGAAIEKFGMATLRRNGVLPWRLAEEFGNLRRAFEGFARGSLYAPSDAVLFAAVASHYIQDAHQPLHASNNYDGQLTGQQGVHARFESGLFERFQSRLQVKTSPVKSVTNPRDEAFDVLLASYELVPQVLEADRIAFAGKNVYDDEYYEKFFARAKPVLERRIGESIGATASIIVGGWEAAGRPVLNYSR
jgi:hypothetical protein